MANPRIDPSSFRDPSGFIFRRREVLFRQVNMAGREDYEGLMASGLYAELLKQNLIVPHTECNEPPENPQTFYKILRPERIPLISYPYEWSFGQLKDAALTTLAIQKLALEFGFSLKDASAYNIQFLRGRPVLIDTLSFEKHQIGEPWTAYRQFCQHFLAPLALADYCDIRLLKMMRLWTDGIPLALASRLLPWPTKFQWGLSIHIHLHSSFQSRYQDVNIAKRKPAFGMSKEAFLSWINSIRATVQKLHWDPRGEWAKYGSFHNYNEAAVESKKKILDQWIRLVKPAVVWDLGANTGTYSQIAARYAEFVVAFDLDPATVEIHYQENKKQGKENILPLVLDLTNPSPSIGWAHEERESLRNRGPADLIMVLALIHHLCIGSNIPLQKVAEYFSELGRWLIIEFVPKFDPQIKKMLAFRKDIFENYSSEGMESAFGEFYHLEEKLPVEGSDRVLYLYSKKDRNV